MSDNFIIYNLMLLEMIMRIQIISSLYSNNFTVNLVKFDYEVLISNLYIGIYFFHYELVSLFPYTNSWDILMKWPKF